MTSPSVAGTRILAIDPTPKGLGFVVFEERRGLIYWGVRNAREHSESLRLFRRLVDRYEPEIVVLGDYRAWDARRPARVRELMKRIARVAATRDIETRMISPAAQEAAFAEVGASTKQQVAMALVRRFPELADALPPVRRLWMSEDYKMAIFDAAALGVAFFHAAQDDAPAA
ncbi:MAG: hypothetical protein ACRD1X_01845 [Vicinamibacteria bacterium]